MNDNLKESYNDGNLILFVGSGVASNLGLPSWTELINEIAKQLNFDPDVFRTYGTYLSLSEYYILMNNGIGELSSWMDTQWHSTDIEIKDSNIYRLIVDSNINIIYTTNYDRWLEKAHEAYKKEYIQIINANDMTKIRDGKRQIIKFHGDLTDDSSIILNEASYFKRLEFESPLDIKFKADIIGKSVLFIGYSLSDINIRLLFYRLSKMWDSLTSSNPRPTSYIFDHKPNLVQKRIMDSWGIKLISKEQEDDPGKALEKFLSWLIED